VNLRTFAIAAAALVFVGGMAHADTIAGTAVFSAAPSDSISITGITDGTGGNNFSIPNVTPGGEATFVDDFMTICTTIPGDENAHATDNIDVAFTITQPGTGSGTLDGTGKETQYDFFGIFDTYHDTLTWNNPLVIALSNNENLTIDLSNLTDLGFAGCGSDLCGNVNAKFQLSDPASPVPEPSTLAFMGTGLLGMAFFGRHKLRELAQIAPLA
jgi:hypothetical protein